MTPAAPFIPLPAAFLTRMQEMLGADYDNFIKSYENPRTFGLKVNTAKISCEEFERLAPFPVKRIPWVKNGYFYEEEARPSRCPLYQAGLYYLQEPSAMTPAARLPIVPGDYVLDLCAAPGGKATALGAALKGEGLLLANDISTSRARALLRNLELFGISNVFVANEKPERLSKLFPEYFDKIMLDAPCSGEGMFRKEEALARDWTPEKSKELSLIQKDLILKAADMLRPGGMLLYSTCTFAPAEDEETISYLLENRPDMELMDMEGYEDFSCGVPAWGNGSEALKKCVRIFPHKMDGEGHFLGPDMELMDMEGYEDFSCGVPAWGNGSEALKKCVRIFPHKMDGEGHFLALFQKSGQSVPSAAAAPRAKLPKDARNYLESFFKEIGLKTLGGKPFDWNRVEARKDNLYYLPPADTDFRGVTFLRNGLFLGELKKNRFEPSQPLALALHKEDVDAIISLPISDERLTRYLKGETLSILPEESPRQKGWQLLCVEGYPLGFGKLVNGILKNKYPAGWRV